MIFPSLMSSILVRQEILLIHLVGTNIISISHLGLWLAVQSFRWQTDYLILRYLAVTNERLYAMNMLYPLLFFTKRIQIYFTGLPTTAKQNNFIFQDSLKPGWSLDISGRWNMHRNIGVGAWGEMKFSYYTGLTQLEWPFAFPSSLFFLTGI